MMMIERSIMTGKIISVEISDAVSIARLERDVWMVCLDQTVLEEVIGYEKAKRRAFEVDRDRQGDTGD